MSDPLPARTLLDYFRHACAAGKPDLLLWKVNGSWTPVSSEEFGRKVRAVATGLAALGVDRGDRVAILSENRPEWAMTDFGTLALGGMTVPVYTTYMAPQVEYILRDSEARVVVVSSRFELEKVLEVRSRCASLRQVVVLDELGSLPAGTSSFSDLVRRGAALDAADPGAFEDRVGSIEPGDHATMIYTSGTTGEPKGAVLTHANFVSNVSAVAPLFPADETKIALSFLPLAHVFERMADYLYFSRRVTIAYAESLDKLTESFAEVRPHFFAAVPRVYEKVLARVLAAVESAPALRQKIFRWGTRVGRERARLVERNEPVGTLLETKFKVADRIVFSKVKARLGGRFEFAISGGAPLAREVAQFFWGAGIEVYEGYGLTETSPVLTCNRPGSFRLGSVGKVVEGVVLRIAVDGEILAKGPNVMQGYWRKSEETRSVFDDEGWFHTGDIGFFDDDGFLTITDRKKEILVNAYGKNVAPAPIEGALKMVRYVSSAVLIGDRRRFLSALIVPNFERLETWAREAEIPFGEPEELVRHPKVRNLFQQAIDIVNGDEPSERRIRSFELLTGDFSIEGGELTPTLKIKRRVISQKYAAVIDGMYEAAEAAAGRGD